MHKLTKIASKLTTYNTLIKLSNNSKNSPGVSNRFIRSCSTAAPETCNPKLENTLNNVQNFNESVESRRAQSRKSILVQVNSEKSYPELYHYCSQFGVIISSHHYSHDEMHYILLEYANSEEAAAATDSSTFNDEISGIVVHSPFLWFRAASKQNASIPLQTTSIVDLSIVNGNNKPSDVEINEALQYVNNVDEQMKKLHKLTCLNDLGVRLRYLAARQIEQSISGMFPSAKALPFGSSVNGFGKLGCDLDLVLRLSSEDKMIKNTSRLIFHTKENLTKGRSQTQRQMENISDILQLFLPGVCHVRRILQARVPIIKYHHEHLDLEVDLAMSNLTGVYMSELLYMFGQIDNRVMPLVFSIRKWAQAVGLTNPSPGRWISNFSLTCLVIFFLQQIKNPILPSIYELTKQARPQDIRITEDHLNCTFLRDLRELKFSSNQENTSSLEMLLFEFLEFYSQMDFSNKAISLTEGKTVSKPDHSPMYIINPLETALNVSKNISLEECERFRIEVRNAAWILESNSGDQMLRQDSGTWGLLSLFKKPGQIRPNMFFKPRMVDVSDLFDDQQRGGTTNGAISTGRKITFKNSFIKNEIAKIQRKNQSDLQQQMKANHISSDRNGLRKR